MPDSTAIVLSHFNDVWLTLSISKHKGVQKWNDCVIVSERKACAEFPLLRLVLPPIQLQLPYIRAIIQMQWWATSIREGLLQKKCFLSGIARMTSDLNWDLQHIKETFLLLECEGCPFFKNPDSNEHCPFWRRLLVMICGTFLSLKRWFDKISQIS